MIEIQKPIDVENHLWCNEAILIRVTGGRSALTTISSDVDYDDYDVKSIFMLNGKPLIQGEYPVCPTCSALLARGYGIDNIDCPEIKSIRDRINSEYLGINNAIEVLTPLLELLDDGYFVIADARLYPTDGTYHYFANVPDSLSTITATCCEYYNHEFLTTSGGFPAYLYPTQSNASLDTKRADHYLDLIDKDNAPRAIAYYHSGFVCALLDGHHKAYAAAQKGCMLSALIIIPMGGTYRKHLDSEELAFFSEIMIPVKELSLDSEIKPRLKRRIQFENYQNQPIYEGDLTFRFYPTIEELTGIYAAEVEKLTITEDLVKQWIESRDTEDRYRLQAVLRYYAKKEPELAFMIAKTVIGYTSESAIFDDLLAESYSVIVNNKCEESEQIVLDYMVNHDSKCLLWDLCSSYWEDVKNDD